MTNKLDGGAGADLLTENAGDDLSVINDASDVGVDLAGGGVDTLASSITTAQGAGLENLTLTAPGNTGTGNALNKLLLAGAGGQSLIVFNGSDTPDGRTGAETIEGATTTTSI